jgi:hypothetical protein
MNRTGHRIDFFEIVLSHVEKPRPLHGVNQPGYCPLILGVCQPVDRRVKIKSGYFGSWTKIQHKMLQFYLKYEIKCVLYLIRGIFVKSIFPFKSCLLATRERFWS